METGTSYLGFFEFVHNVRRRQEAFGCADRPVVGTTLQSILSHSQFPRPDFHRQVQRHYGLQNRT